MEVSLQRSGAGGVNAAKIELKNAESRTDQRAGVPNIGKSGAFFVKSLRKGGFNGLRGQAGPSASTPRAGNSHPVGVLPPPHSNITFHHFAVWAPAPEVGRSG